MMRQKLFIHFFFFTIITVVLLPGCSKNQIQYEPNLFIRDWLILGPLPNCEECSTSNYHHDDRCKGFYTDFLKKNGGEKDFIPLDGEKVQIRDGKLDRTWFAYSSEEDKIQLSKLVKPKDMVVAYAFSQIESPKNQKSILSIGSNDGIRVFLNGNEIHESHDYNGRWLQSDDDYIPVQLKAGTNNLMLKIDQGTGDYSFMARFLDYDSVVTKIRDNIESYKTLKVVARGDTLAASFGTGYQISVLNPNGKVNIGVYQKTNKLFEKKVFPGEDAEFLMAGLPEGYITLKASFPTPENGIIVSETMYFNGKLERHPPVKRISKDLTIIDKNGTPFLPIGTYGAPVEDYQILKEAGYNFVVASVENLDKVNEAGLLAAVPIHSKDPREYYNIISKNKNHPAVLCWMLYDEPGYNKADLLYIYDIYNAAYEADKVHPSYLVITTPTVYKSFGRFCDVLAVDTYPITNGVIEEVGENIAKAYQDLGSEVPVWHCGQMFTWPEQRRPVPQEHRFMTYFSLINGAKGLLWYTFKGYGQYLPVDDPGLWESHKSLLAELNELSELFIEPGFGNKVQLDQSNESVTAIVKESSIGTYLIAANKSKSVASSAEFIINNKYDGEAPVYNEKREVTVQNGKFTDEFKPLAVHIYELRIKNDK